MSAIFISHRSTDNEAAAEIHAWLEDQGHNSVFLDFDPADGIPAGRNWEQEIYQQLKTSRAVIVVCSKQSMASKWVFAEITHARALGKFIVPLKIEECTVERLISDRQVIDMTVNKDDAFRRLRSGLLKAGIDPHDAFSWDGVRPPFPGLLAFNEEDAAVFFGRSDEITEGLSLMNRIRRQDVGEFAMVLGASGSGKSSLVRAGLVPRLRRDPERWLVVGPFRPRDDPSRELAGALKTSLRAEGDFRDWRSIQAMLDATGDEDGTEGNKLVEISRDLLMQASRPDARVLLVIDQFEELLGYGSDHPATRLLATIREAAEAKESPIVVLGTMRSDFLGVFQNSSPLLGVRFQSLSVGPLSSDEITQVVEEPAAIAGLGLETGLAALLVTDTEAADALPLLAFTLRELYENYGDDGRLEVTDYREGLGGLHGAVANVADELIESQRLDDEQVELLRKGFLTMVRLTDDERWAKQVARWEDLPGSIRPVLDRFVTARLLVSGGGTDGNTLEVSHEALFRSWGVLAEWLDNNRAALRLRADIRRAATTWDEEARSNEYLWRGVRLTHAVELRDTGDLPLDPLDVAFIDASELEIRTQIEAENRRRRRRLQISAAVAAGASVLALVAVVFFFRANSESVRANDAAAHAEEQALLAEQESARADEQRLVAEEQSRVANEQRLKAEEETARADETAAIAMAHQAQALVDSNPALAVAVAAEASARSDGPVAQVAAIRSNAALRASSLVANLGSHTDRVQAVAFSPDGTLVATASNDGTAIIWDAASGEELLTLEGHDDWVRDIAFSHDGALVVTSSDDETAIVWDAATGRALRILEGHDDWVGAVVYSPDGSRIATASDDTTAIIWNASTGEPLVTLAGHEDWVNGVAFSPDGALVATASDDETVIIWNAESGAELRTLEGHVAWVEDVAFSPDGATVATASGDGTVGIWNTETGVEKLTISGHDGPVNAVAFNDEGTVVATASGDETIKVWDATTGEELATLTGHTSAVSDVVFGPTGAVIGSAGFDDTAKLWDVQGGTGLQTFGGHTEWVNAAAFSPDGALVATASDDGTVIIWDSETGAAQVNLTEHTDWVRSVAFSPDGSLVATASDDGTAIVWNAATGENLLTVPGHSDLVRGVAFLPDGSAVVTASDDGTARLWNVETGDEVLALNGHQGPVTSVAVSDSGAFIATGSADGTARIWDVATGREVLSIPHRFFAVSDVDLSSDGKLIATSSEDGTASVWDAGSGALKFKTSGHRGPVYGVAFNDDDTQIVTAGQDGTAIVWATDSGERLYSLSGHEEAVSGVAFNHDGTRIVTASGDGTATVWDSSNESSCALVGLLVTTSELTETIGGVVPIACTDLRP